MKNLVQVFLTALLLYCFAFVPATHAEDGMVLYVKEGCSHCAKVEAFIEEHSLGDTLTIRDIVLDAEASEEYTAFMDEQDVPLEERGAVPVLTYGGNKWISGDTPIIDYLAEINDITIEKAKADGSSNALIIAGAVIVLVVFGYGIVNRPHVRKNG